MGYLTFGQEEKHSYKICILVNDIRRDEIERAYIRPYDLPSEDILVLDLHQARGKKHTPVKEIKAYILEELVPVLRDQGVEYLIIADGDYFKTFTKTVKIDKVLGYMLDTEYGPWKVTYVPNFRVMFHDPFKVKMKITQGINAMKAWMNGTYQDPGVEIIKSCAYPQTIQEIADWLDRLFEMNRPLTVDIEGFSLKHYKAEIGTIAFAWSKDEGVAFPVDILDNPDHSFEIRGLLRSFFTYFENKIIYHNIGYDVTVLIYELFMENLLDNEGLLEGLEIMLKNWDDTKLITYLATNSCSGNKLGLKDQAQEYAGNYAVDSLQDIRKVPLPQLLQYNLVDCLSTWFVHEKHWPTLVRDQQLDIYEGIFKPAMVDIIQMQLTGMPVDMNQVQIVKQQLQNEYDRAKGAMNYSIQVQELVYDLNQEWVDWRNTELKKKVVSFADANEEFNPNSGPQLIKLLYGRMGLPVISKTETGLPSTDGETLENLLNHTAHTDTLNFLHALIAYKAVNKILTSVIPALETAQLGPDGWHYLFGNFNLGGTVSGRLSSSDPNLQNLPAKEGYSKLIKSCFKAPPGWFFCGIDFSSLEDKISALTTKDPNKLKVYIDGYDGHSLRAYAYFGESMPDIIADDIASINSIQKKYPHERQDSKAPTFALTYQGTYHTLMINCGFSEEKARSIESKYHELYKVSDQWVSAKLDQACKDGYITAAFGLRLRTPMLHQVVRGTSKTPKEASQEGRTAGNALGQSWCLLNSRACSEFMGIVRGGKHRHSIKPCAQIHDALYFLVRDDSRVIEYTNNRIVMAVEWQEHPDIKHDKVKLGGEFSIFYPDWSQEVVIPNGASEVTINYLISERRKELSPK